jgi:hypothetical protein
MDKFSIITHAYELYHKNAGKDEQFSFEAAVSWAMSEYHKQCMSDRANDQNSGNMRF